MVNHSVILLGNLKSSQCNFLLKEGSLCFVGLLKKD